MNANIKYLKDESGNKFSPVTSCMSLMMNCKNGSYTNLKEYLQGGQSLFSGKIDGLNTITLNDYVYNYRYLWVYYTFDGSTLAKEWDCVYVNGLSAGVGLYKAFKIFYATGHLGIYGVNTYIVDNTIQCKNGWGWTRTEQNVTSGYFTNSNQVNIRNVIGMK